MEAVEIIDSAIPGFGHDRQCPRVVALRQLAGIAQPLDHRIAHDADTVGIGHHHGPGQQARLVNPGGAGHFTVAVQPEPTGQRRIGVGTEAARQDCGDAGADRALALLQWRLAGNQRRVAHQDPGDVGDGIVGSRGSVEWHTEVSGARATGSCRHGGGNHDPGEADDEPT